MMAESSPDILYSYRLISITIWPRIYVIFDLHDVTIDTLATHYSIIFYRWQFDRNKLRSSTNSNKQDIL